MDCQSIMRQYSKQFLTMFNFFFAFIGALIITLATSIKAYYHEYENFLETKYFYASDFMIIVGVIVLVISFCGCYGALKENACLTTCYSSLLIFILVLEVLVAIGGILLKSKAEGVVEDGLNKTIQLYGLPQQNETTEIWDTVQKRFHCCGVTNATDWIEKTNTTHGKLPLSCCTIPSGSTDTFTCNPTSKYINNEGCLLKLSDYIKSYATQIEGVGIGVALFQLLSIILSCYLSKQIRSDYETV